MEQQPVQQLSQQRKLRARTIYKPKRKPVGESANQRRATQDSQPITGDYLTLVTATSG